jgi:branched-chain amino acid transport system substrate-binding protein
VASLSKSDPIFGSAKEWNYAFKAAYPSYTSVPYQSVQASAAVYVWKVAFETANSFDKDAVRIAIATTEMETFYSDIKFSDAGNNIAKPMFIRQINFNWVCNLIKSTDQMINPRDADCYI